jgi:hypothetical protein
MAAIEDRHGYSALTETRRTHQPRALRPTLDGVNVWRRKKLTGQLMEAVLR